MDYLSSISIYFILIFRVSHCCVPIPLRPQGGNGSSGNGSLENEGVTTTSSEESTTTSTEESTTTTGATTIEKAKTTFYIDHKSRTFHCIFEFSLQFKEGINIMDEATSKCVETSSANDAVKFLGKLDFLVTSTRGFDVSCNINIVFEENDDQIKMSDKVVLQSMRCSPAPGQCLTEDGLDYPNTCTFPFIYQDRIYQACTDWKNGVQGDRLWCATETSGDETMVPDRWSWCNDFCGYCGGKDLKNTNTSQIETYGECKTLTGRNCIFPFKDGTKEYRECAQYRDIYHWCAVTTNPDGSYLKWDKCDPENCPLEGAGKCKTVSGPDSLSTCIFPFKDGSKEYTSCAPWKSKFWCATSVSTDGSFLSYGYCASDGTCPLSQTRRTLKMFKSDLTCGYNCFINLKKMMVSFTEDVSQDMLLPPASIVGELTEPDWNILPGGKYQFLIGQKGIDLKCPDGTTFSKFSEDSQISVACTGEYSFTVQGLTTGQKWEGEENVNFGCNPCSANYRAVTGYISPAYGLAFHYSVKSLSSCEELCENTKKCQIFQYGSISKQCSLHEGEEKLESTPEVGQQVCKSEKHKCAIPLKSYAIKSPDLESIREGETVTYKCVDSTEMVGDPINMCTKKGFVNPLPSCSICCDSILLNYELGADLLDNVGYYDRYNLQPDLQNGHLWYKSTSGDFKFWKMSISEKEVWVLGEFASEKIVAQLEADGCPNSPENIKRWELLVMQTKHSGGKRIGKVNHLNGLLNFCDHRQQQNIAEIFTIPVGQGESTLIKCPNSDEHILVDMGSVKKAKIDENAILPLSLVTYLGNARFNDRYFMTSIFLTHPDKDHISHVLLFLRALKIGQQKSNLTPKIIDVYFGGDEGIWKTASTFSHDLWFYCDKENHIEPHYMNINPDTAPTPESVVPLCYTDNINYDAVMHILAAGMGHNNNGQSLVLKLVSSNQEEKESMLFMGDFEGYNFYDRLIRGRVQQLKLEGTDSVMTIPHHGSRTVAGTVNKIPSIAQDNMMKLFYKTVQPRHAIISSHIEHSGYHHPQWTTVNNICFRSPMDADKNKKNMNKQLNLNEKNGQGWEEIGTDWRVRDGNCDPTVTHIYQTSIRIDISKKAANNNKFYIIKTSLDWKRKDIETKIDKIPWALLATLQPENPNSVDGGDS